MCELLAVPRELQLHAAPIEAVQSWVVRSYLGWSIHIVSCNCRQYFPCYFHVVVSTMFDEHMSIVVVRYMLVDDLSV